MGTQIAVDPLIQMHNLNMFHKIRSTDFTQVVLNIRSQILSKGSEQDLLVSQTMGSKLLGTMHRNDRFSCASAAQNASGSFVFLANNTPLRRMQIHTPHFKRSVHHGLQVFFSLSHIELHLRNRILQCRSHIIRVLSSGIAIQFSDNLFGIKTNAYIIQSLECIPGQFPLCCVKG